MNEIVLHKRIVSGLLATAMTDLDQTNIDTSLDTSLTQLDQDASNF